MHQTKSKAKLLVSDPLPHRAFMFQKGQHTRLQWSTITTCILHFPWEVNGINCLYINMVSYYIAEMTMHFQVHNIVSKAKCKGASYSSSPNPIGRTIPEQVYAVLKLVMSNFAESNLRVQFVSPVHKLHQALIKKSVKSHNNLVVFHWQ